MKKGKKSWKPSAQLPVHNRPEGYQLRWVDVKDPANHARRLADGWVPVSQLTNSKTGVDDPTHIEDGKKLTTITEHRGAVLMALPDEDYQEHREYFREQTQRQTVGLRQKAEQRFQNKQRGEMTAEIYGETTIQRTIIK